jgi:hypothetical protein
MRQNQTPKAKKVVQKMKTLSALKADVQRLEQAYKTIAEDRQPAQVIAAIELLLATFKETERRLTSELRTMIRNVVKLTARGAATDDHREMVDRWRANIIALSADISALEWGLYLHQQWSKVKPA